MSERVRLIDLAYAAFESGSLSGSESEFQPDLICPCASHRSFWRSIHGPHLICGVCHPPAVSGVVAEWIDVGLRQTTTIEAVSTDRARRKANVIPTDAATSGPVSARAGSPADRRAGHRARAAAAQTRTAIAGAAMHVDRRHHSGA